MTKPLVGTVHISVFMNELEPTGEIGLNVNPYAEKGIHNIIIKTKPNSKENIVKELLEILAKIEGVKNGYYEM